MIRCFVFPVVKAVATSDSALELPLTEENVESVLDEVRPYLIADGGNVALHEIDGNVVRLKLQGACGSCPSSVTTMKLGIERRLMEKIPEIVAVEAVPDEETGLELNEENIEKVCLAILIIMLENLLSRRNVLICFLLARGSNMISRQLNHDVNSFRIYVHGATLVSNIFLGA